MTCSPISLMERVSFPCSMPAEHHPVADVGRARVGGALELLDDRLRAAEVERVQEGLVVGFAVVWDGVNRAVGDFVAVQAALGAHLPAHIRQRL